MNNDTELKQSEALQTEAVPEAATPLKGKETAPDVNESGLLRFVRSRLGCFIIFTIIWLIGCVILQLTLSSTEKGVIWVEDGAYQHFTSFNYSCDFIDSLFGGEPSASTGLYNYTLGRGADIITTLNSYGFTDPVQWLCALLVPISRFARYKIMLFLNLYLIGAAFIVYCFSIDRKKNWAILAGAVTYAFSGVVLCMFMRHPNYINWAYFLPLLFAGYELLRRRRRCLPLILFVAANAVVSFYTFYMNMILLIIYIIINSLVLIITNRKNNPGKVFVGELIEALKAAGLSLVGMLLAAVLFLPTIGAFLNNARVAGVSGYSASAIHYPLGFYRRVFVNAFQPYGESGYSTILGLAAIVLFAVVALFAMKKRTPLKIWVILGVVMMAVPFAGRVMNGFGYATNRWTYAFVFFCSVILVEMLPRLHKLSRVARWVCCGISAVYIVLAFLLFKGDSGRLIKTTTIVLALTLIAIMVFIHIKKEVLRSVLIALLALGCALFQLWGTFSPSMADYLDEFADKSEIDSLYEDSSQLLSGASTAEDFFRVESRERRMNIDGMLNVKSTDIWWSMLPSYMIDSLLDMEMNEISYNCYFAGSDGRSSVMELASVKYYTEPYDGSSLVPAGYELNTELSTRDYFVYENKYALPVAYVLDGYITRDDFEEMSALERQQAMMQAAVLEEDDAEKISGISKIGVQTGVQQIPYTIGYIDGVELTEPENDHTPGYIDADENGYMVLAANVPENCEIYLRLGGIELEDPDTSVIFVSRENEFGDYYVPKLARITNMENLWPVVRDGVTFNLGIGGEGENTIVLRFADDAEFYYDSLELLVVPMDAYEEQAAALLNYRFENSYVDGRRISGDIELPEDKLLQFSVPYSTGWSAYVDGKKTDIVRSDGMYMAIPLSAGPHVVELRYSTPLMLPGAILSVVTLIGIIVLGIIRKKKVE